MRLIDADKIVYSWQIDADGQEHDGITLQSIIKKMPTIEERKTGRWEYHSNPTFGVNPEDAYCSECGFHVDTTAVDDFDDYNFCPRCGARMEVDNE